MARPVIFDLDGTLAESGPIIVEVLTATAAAHGHQVTPATLGDHIGPPLWETFERITGEPWEQIAAMLADYRRRYAVAMLETPLYPGVADLVAELHRAGVPLAVATSKRTSVARDLLAHLGLAEFFVAICGAPDDERPATKADSIADALAGLRAAGADAEQAIMVGDRIHDIHGARTHHIPSVFVNWGYGRAHEAAEADAVVGSLPELRALLLERTMP